MSFKKLDLELEMKNYKTEILTNETQESKENGIESLVVLSNFQETKSKYPHHCS